MPALSLKSLQKVTVTAGTELALSATKVLAKGLIIKALPANTDEVYVGAAGVSATSGFVLEAGEQIDYAQVLGLSPDDTIDLSKIYVDSAVDAEGISAVYLSL